MTRFSFVVLAAVGLFACPPQVPPPDAGVDDGGPNPPPMDACSGGCAINQVCDTKNRICVDGCGGCASDGGLPGICTKTPQGTFQCLQTVVECSGNTCETGQVACIAGACSCLGPSRGTFDTCFGDPARPGAPGEVCVDGSCANPKNYQECVVGGAACPTGDVCQPVFGQSLSVCTRKCTMTSSCDRGEICSNVGCLPSGLFTGQQCALQQFRYTYPDGGLISADAGVLDGGVTDDGGVPTVVVDPNGQVIVDGGTELIELTVAVGSKCFTKDEGGNINETVPSGTCTYAFFYFADQGPYEFPTCRPPGGAAENTDCTQNPAVTAQATQCQGGLECALMRGGDLGICMRACNALEPGRMYANPQPRCAGEDAGELCLNLYKREDINQEGGLMGVCAMGCNVFDMTKSVCPDFGSTHASCVPTDPAGRITVTPDGAGVCLPQQPTIAALGAACNESDPFHGAVCATGQVCPPEQPDKPSVCTQVCDLGCSTPAADGGFPSRCTNAVHSTCPSDKTCTRVNSTLSARLGFCL